MTATSLNCCSSHTCGVHTGRVAAAITTVFRKIKGRYLSYLWSCAAAALSTTRSCKYYNIYNKKPCVNKSILSIETLSEGFYFEIETGGHSFISRNHLSCWGAIPADERQGTSKTTSHPPLVMSRQC